MSEKPLDASKNGKKFENVHKFRINSNKFTQIYKFITVRTLEQYMTVVILCTRFVVSLGNSIDF